MVKLTVIFGLLTLFVIAVPTAPLFGVYLLILPGIILYLAPTIFLYSATATFLRKVLPFGNGYRGTATAILLSFCLGFLVTQPMRIAERNEFYASLEPNIIPDSPVHLSGNVYIERNRKILIGGGGYSDCNAVCAALLSSPDVESVTVVTRRQNQDPIVASWHMVSAENVDYDNTQNYAPIRPEEIVNFYPYKKINRELSIEERNAQSKKNIQAHNDESDAIKEGWRNLLSEGRELVPREKLPVPDFTIVMETHDLFSSTRILSERVEIYDQSNSPLLRKSVKWHKPVSSPLYFEMGALIKHIPFRPGRGWIIAHGKKEINSNTVRFHPVKELLLHAAVSPIPGNAAR